MAMGGKNERGYRIGVEEASSGFLVPEYSPALQASQAIGDPADQVAYVTAFPQTQEPIHGEDFSPALGRTSIGMGVQIGALREHVRPGSNTDHTVIQGASVRRLTPTECERLQALPDGWTAFGPDSRRYAALGDAVTSSVGEWIGRRLTEASA